MYPLVECSEIKISTASTKVGMLIKREAPCHSAKGFELTLIVVPDLRLG
jgi:hypothetical protein